MQQDAFWKSFSLKQKQKLSLTFWRCIYSWQEPCLQGCEMLDYHFFAQFKTFESVGIEKQALFFWSTYEHNRTSLKVYKDVIKTQVD